MGNCVNKLAGEGDGQNGGKPTASRLREDKIANRQFEDQLRFLQGVPLFSRLDLADVPLIGEALELKEYTAGQCVIKEGERGDAFFLVKSGLADVLKGDKLVASLKAGDYFGETSLLQDEPRNATIKVSDDATKPLKCYRLSREKFDGLGVMQRIRFPRRRAVAEDKKGEAQPGSEPQGTTTKTEEEVALIKAALDGNKYLSAILSQTQREQMVEKAWKLEVSAGTEVTKEGSLQADRFYIVVKGLFAVKKAIGKVTSVSADEIGRLSVDEDSSINGGDQGVKGVGELGPGSSFGELALLYNAPRAATVEANEDSVLFVIDRFHFKSILKSQTQKRQKEYEKLLCKVDLLNSLLGEEREALVDCLVEIHFRQGEKIITQGEHGDTFYFLYGGTVGFYQDEKKLSTSSANPETGECPSFGEKALLGADQRTATVVVESETAAVLALDRATFESVLGPLKEIIAHEGMKGRKSYRHGTDGPLAKEKPEEVVVEKMTDLQTMGLLGAGGFGAVTLEYHKKSKKSFAMKQISKGYIVKMHLQEQILNERKILMMTSSPFITRCYMTFNKKSHVFFLLEACLGGEIFAVYNRKRLHGSLPHATFYSACVVQAFEHLHARRIIYRDLKPENMLLDDKGYCKLTDMGLAKFVFGRTYTLCGTPDYFAPEIVQSVGHTNAVDWWTFGILLYELLMGHPPFESVQEPMAKYRKIAMGLNSNCKFPPERFTDHAADLIKNMCHKDPSQRLPMRPGGLVQNVYSHPFYDSDKWGSLKSMSLKVPYKPRVKNTKDISNFNAHQDDIPPSVPYADPGNGWDKDFGPLIK